MKRKIYLASSWRNTEYPDALATLREDGHEVYDFRASGFRWDELHPAMPTLAPGTWWPLINERAVARAHFAKDFSALKEADTVVQMLPSGRSASWEAGYALGAGKPTFLYFYEQAPVEAELMAMMFLPRVYLHWAELRAALLVAEKVQPVLTPQTLPRSSLLPKVRRKSQERF